MLKQRVLSLSILINSSIFDHWEENAATVFQQLFWCIKFNYSTFIKNYDSIII